MLTRREELIEQYRILHAREKYGASSEKQIDFITPWLKELGPINTILDFGCGQSQLVDWLARDFGAQAFRYDPAIEQFNQFPVDKADVVINTDVLEHIPLEDVDGFIARIASISEKVFFNISNIPAVAILPNGENAHCTVEPPEWWAEQLAKHFAVVRRVPSYRPSTSSFITWLEPA
ncbi:class I SAM-dependent methyltransferase [Ensifer sesbaniae]|uniref:class I SAM-dependent methyltransferase n=1 Tax=Ensifer sesbaniae TaxID=1214071 RepID=UPI0015695A6F|nr:methyltransferase domain-containing protein [Ensifer sesbaniae]NRQ14613.1 hypothetical protein [Ensifer sesbaniae]